MPRSPTRATMLTAVLLSATGCQLFCGGSLDEYCSSNACVWTWEEATAKATGDTGGELYGCSEGDMLMAHGYMMGRTHYYDGESGDLEAVVEWSDIEEYCGDSSFTRTWGEHGDCSWSCTYEEELESEHYPLCEEAQAR